MASRVIASIAMAATLLVAYECRPQESAPPVCVETPERLSPDETLAFCYGEEACIPLPASVARPGQRQVCFDVKNWEGTKYIWRESKNIMIGLIVDGRHHLLHYRPDATFEPDRSSVGVPVTGGRFRVQGIKIDDASIVVSKETLLRSTSGSEASDEILLRRETATRPEGYSESKERLKSWTGWLTTVTPLMMSGEQGTYTLRQIAELRTAEQKYQLWYAPGVARLRGGGTSSTLVRVTVRGVLVEPGLIVVLEERKDSR